MRAAPHDRLCAFRCNTVRARSGRIAGRTRQADFRTPWHRRRRIGSTFSSNPRRFFHVHLRRARGLAHDSPVRTRGTWRSNRDPPSCGHCVYVRRPYVFLSGFAARASPDAPCAPSRRFQSVHDEGDALSDVRLPERSPRRVTCSGRRPLWGVRTHAMDFLSPGQGQAWGRHIISRSPLVSRPSYVGCIGERHTP